MKIQDNTQSPAQHIEQDIDTTTMVIYGKMRNGKTLLSICLACDYIFDDIGKIYDNPRVYSNFDIYYKGKQINKSIKQFSDVENIRFSYVPGLLIIDESGINNNSKDGMSKENRLMQEALFLIGKKNLSLIWIAQRHKSVDINGRELADTHFKCKKKYKHGYSRPLFVITRKHMTDEGKLLYKNDKILDAIGFLKRVGISYNQLESSKMKKIKQEQEDEKSANLV